MPRPGHRLPDAQASLRHPPRQPILPKGKELELTRPARLRSLIGGLVLIDLAAVSGMVIGYHLFGPSVASAAYIVAMPAAAAAWGAWWARRRWPQRAVMVNLSPTAKADLRAASFAAADGRRGAAR